jgi:hypothetical protein
MEYEIQLIDKTLARLHPYRLSPPKMQFLSEHVKISLRVGMTELSLSNYSSPMFFVPKPGGANRAVVESRMLDKPIPIDSIPFPDVLQRSIGLRRPIISPPCTQNKPTTKYRWPRLQNP